MDKLHYDNLYKFLVSLGIALIVLPVAALVLLFNVEPILISQTDYDSLSEFSLQMIAHRNELTAYFLSIFPWFAGILICAGIGILCIGIIKWLGLQKNLDKKLDAETAIQTLTFLKMSNAEVTAKIEDEIKESAEIETPTSPDSPDVNGYSSAMDKYIKIEELCFAYFAKKYARYSFERNIRMGRYSYDFIGVSKFDNIDLIFEIKYIKIVWNSKRMGDVFNRVYSSGINYEKIAHRNFKCIVVIVTPKENLPRVENKIEMYCMAHSENANKIEIKCMAEESL